MLILGVHCGHDSAATLVDDGIIIADVAEERFTRIKHDSSFPYHSIAYCLEQARVRNLEVAILAISGQKTPIDFERFFVYSNGMGVICSASSQRLKKAQQLLTAPLVYELPTYMERLVVPSDCKIVHFEHHLCHAAASYFTSGYEADALILTMDGVGDGVSTAFWLGSGNSISPLKKWGSSASLGWFYGNVTEALGWRHGDGEGSTMGLAPYGDPTLLGTALSPYHPTFNDGDLAIPHDFGGASVFNDHGFLHWHLGEASVIRNLAQQFGNPNVAASAQSILEDETIALLKSWVSKTDANNICLGGGIFLNVKLNQRIFECFKSQKIWICPNPADSGLAMGAALCAWHQHGEKPANNRLPHLYFGPSSQDDEIEALLKQRNLHFERLEDPANTAAHLLASNYTVAWFQGAMESGPRALGNRSILMSARKIANKEVLNTKVKFRESFRPFCPVILHEKKDRYLVNCDEAAFMITSFDAIKEQIESIPAAVHIDGTVRPQVLRQEANPLFYKLVETYGRLTGEYILLNTSFNLKNEPIVCSPREAIKCFYDSGLDFLIIGPFLLSKK